MQELVDSAKRGGEVSAETGVQLAQDLLPPHATEPSVVLTMKCVSCDDKLCMMGEEGACRIQAISRNRTRDSYRTRVERATPTKIGSIADQKIRIVFK